MFKMFYYNLLSEHFVERSFQVLQLFHQIAKTNFQKSAKMTKPQYLVISITHKNNCKECSKA